MAPRRRERSPINPYTKYFLFFENFLIWVAGICITIAGSYILYLKKKVVKDAFDFFLDPSMCMVVAGSLVIVITFFGCMGSLRENTCFLRLYNIIMTIFFIGELLLVIFVFVFYFVPDAREKLGLFPEDAMKDAIRKYGVVDDQDMVNLIDNIQKTLHCCGLSDKDDGFLDWNENLYFNCTKDGKSTEKCSVPPSCCKIKPGDHVNILCGRNVMTPAELNSKTIVADDTNTAKIYKVGCLKALGQWINDNALVLGGILLGILLPQLFIMCLARSLRDQILAQKLKWKKSPRLRERSPTEDDDDINYTELARRGNIGHDNQAYNKY